MENKNRLTQSDDLGNWGIKGLLWKNLYEGEVITREIYEKLYGCLAKLKDYEETELSPEEVEDGSLYIRLGKKHGCIELMLDTLIQYEEIGTVEEFRILKEKDKAKAIDEFAEQLKKRVAKELLLQIYIDEDNLLDQDKINKYIDDTAEQLKVGIKFEN